MYASLRMRPRCARQRASLTTPHSPPPPPRRTHTHSHALAPQATLITSARGLSNGVAKPNHGEGHGRVALADALPLGATSRALFAHDGALAANTVQAFVLTVMAGAAEADEASVTLAWTDPPATVQSNYQGGCAAAAAGVW
jgi:hypothetical protein